MSKASLQSWSTVWNNAHQSISWSFTFSHMDGN